MEHQDRRACPFCGADASRPAPPYANRYADIEYRYWRCTACASHFIDPVPDAAQRAQLFDPARYHASFYETVAQERYRSLAGRLAGYLRQGSRVLDYGCGNGQLLAALVERGLAPVGVEVSQVAADNAAARSGCLVWPESDSRWRATQYDAVVMVDVIGHLADPAATLRTIAATLRPGGILCVEGTIEANPSLVGFVARSLAAAKRTRGHAEPAGFPPFDVNFATGPAQRALFHRLGVPLVEREWRIFETGWPYRRNGAVRNAVALAAIALSKLPPGRGRLGNKFFAVFERG